MLNMQGIVHLSLKGNSFMPATNILALSMPRKESDSEVNSFPLKLGEKRLKFILLLFITIDYSPFSSFPLH